eukprot:TRINITY_DN28607_c0_g1_i2.p1 TRINITY_DN28607_c0_g1~~TRINITY_DN28607_c0_g1_i2.p1  ORF type:complete len:448 (+),score=112.09 TRINITY_DN28607_c0_g1_i2:66-1409(+)
MPKRQREQAKPKRSGSRAPKRRRSAESADELKQQASKRKRTSGAARVGGLQAVKSLVAGSVRAAVLHGVSFEVKAAVLSCTPACEVGKLLQQRAASGDRGWLTTKKKKLPAGWKLSTARPLEFRFCETLRLALLILRYSLHVRCEDKPTKRFDLRAMLFFDPAHPNRVPNVQSVSCDHRPMDYARTVVLAVHALSTRRPGRALVLGVGGAVVLTELHALGWDVTGIDVSAEVVAAARTYFGAPEGVKLNVADASEYLERATSKFDVIVCDVFTDSALSRDRVVGMCRQAARLLRPGSGTLVVNMNSLTQPGSRGYLADLIGSVGGRQAGSGTVAAWVLPVPLFDMSVLAVRCGGALSSDWAAVLKGAHVPGAADYGGEYLDPDRMFPGFKSISWTAGEWAGSSVRQVGDAPVLTLPGYRPKAGGQSNEFSAARVFGDLRRKHKEQLA